ncbi:hypothetical protein GCM10025880_07510 [Methylorubrum aminovorans]|nr:hypothetical protein GCM10025880_07510 [Methylorubrum aminovorans]
MISSPDAGAFARRWLRLRRNTADGLRPPRIGHTIGVGEDEIHAVMEVESSGGGFDRLKRPKMLFEPHVLWRNLSGAERTRAASLGLAYASWKPGAYPTDSYPRLMQAMAINETAALKASSWGLGQILGENHRARRLRDAAGDGAGVLQRRRGRASHGNGPLHRHERPRRAAPARLGGVRPRLQRGRPREARLSHQARGGLRQVVEDQGHALVAGHG